MDQQKYRKLISGQTNGWLGKSLRFFLMLASPVYAVVISLRNFLYFSRLLKTHHSNAAVISVGNITVGGTGKTPLVIWVYNKITENSKLKAQNCKCAILSRGYKTDKTCSDEPAMLAKSCPQAKVVINPDRVAGAERAVNEFGANVLIMDDGFQHRRLGRDLDIVTIDATLPFGYGKMLPAGLLREPVTALKRADAVVVTRTDQQDEAELARLEEKLRSVNPDMKIARSIHTPVCAKTRGGEEIGLEQLKDKKIFAFCGIANPDAFFHTIGSLGLELAGTKVYNDHYHYTNADIVEIYEQAEALEADLILSTQKDWTKTVLPASAKKDILFAYLAIELRFISGEDKITELIEKALAGKITQK